jgi:hypothetical protein
LPTAIATAKPSHIVAITEGHAIAIVIAIASIIIVIIVIIIFILASTRPSLVRPERQYATPSANATPYWTSVSQKGGQHRNIEGSGAGGQARDAHYWTGIMF